MEQQSQFTNCQDAFPILAMNILLWNNVNNVYVIFLIELMVPIYIYQNIRLWKTGIFIL